MKVEWIDDPPEWWGEDRLVELQAIVADRLSETFPGDVAPDPDSAAVVDGLQAVVEDDGRIALNGVVGIDRYEALTDRFGCIDGTPWWVSVSFGGPTVAELMATLADLPDWQLGRGLWWEHMDDDEPGFRQWTNLSSMSVATFDFDGQMLGLWVSTSLLPRLDVEADEAYAQSLRAEPHRLWHLAIGHLLDAALLAVERSGKRLEVGSRADKQRHE